MMQMLQVEDLNRMSGTAVPFLNSHSLVKIERAAIAELVIQRHFVGKNKKTAERLEPEAVARSLCPGPDFEATYNSALADAEGGFAPELNKPSVCVEEVFRAYAQTELGSIGMKLILITDEVEINKGWRNKDATLTKKGITAYGAGQWRPFRVASGDVEHDTVTPSGVLLLPDEFPHAKYYATGDEMHAVAMLHHEIMAHVLPQKEAAAAGREAEMVCIRYESEMLRELGLPERKLNWGKERGTLDHTLHIASGQYYQGLVQYDAQGELIEVDPETKVKISLAVKQI